MCPVLVLTSKRCFTRCCRVHIESRHLTDSYNFLPNCHYYSFPLIPCCHSSVASHCSRSSVRVSLVLSGSMQDLEGREELSTPVHDTRQGSQQVPSRPEQYRMEGEIPTQCLTFAADSRDEEDSSSLIAASLPSSPSLSSLTSHKFSRNSDLQWIEPEASFDANQRPIISAMRRPTDPVSPRSSQQPLNCNTPSPVSSVSLSPLSPCHFLGRASPQHFSLSSFPSKQISGAPVSPVLTGADNTPPRILSPPASPPAASLSAPHPASPSAPPSPSPAKHLSTDPSKGITLPQQSERWSIIPRLGHPCTKIK